MRVRIKRIVSSNWMFKVVGTMVFDRFKSWKKGKKEGKICPACQHNNLKETNVCTRCYYQLDRPSFEQDTTLDDSQSSDLLEELMKEVEEQEEEIVAASFSLDDVTVDIEQYSDDDVDILGNPDMSNLFESKDEIYQDENYELKPEDSPQFVQKFEIPERQEKEDDSKELEPTRIELIHPTAETPDTVEIQSPSEILNVSDSWEKNNEIKSTDPLDFDGDGKVDAYEQAFANQDKENNIEIQDEKLEKIESEDKKIPRIKAKPVIEPDFSDINDFSETEKNSENQTLENELHINNHNFWPWEQQEEWSIDEVKRQLLTALRAAAEHNIAEATVLIDEVGPHLGSRHSLVYAVGKLLRIIGRTEETERMITLATKHFPEDKEIILAANKLVS